MKGSHRRQNIIYDDLSSSMRALLSTLKSSYMMTVHHIGCCWMGEGEFPRYMKWLLVQAMKRRGLTYKDLADLLREAYGVDYDAKVLGTKVSRGRFSAAFFVQALLAMGCDGIAFNEPPAKQPKRSTGHDLDTKRHTNQQGDENG